MTPIIIIAAGVVLVVAGAAWLSLDVIEHNRLLARQDALIAQQDVMLREAQAVADRKVEQVRVMGGFVRTLVARVREVEQ